MKRGRIDITGQRFTKLVAIKPVIKKNNVSRCTVWICKCDCGNVCEVRLDHLRSGKTKSCGCLRREIAEKRSVKHGCKRRGRATAEYIAWGSMKDRCFNFKNKRYHNYGGRGITVCDRWFNSFENFLKDMGEKPNSELSIDRIDNNGNYEPGNCRWATNIEQGANISSLRWFFASNEKTKEVHESNNQHDFARRYNLNNSHISACLCGKRKTHKGWKFKYSDQKPK